MQLTNQYYFFKEAIPPETCQRIIDLGLEKIEKQKSEGRNVEAYTYGEMQKGARPDAQPQGEASMQTLKAEGVDNVYVRDSKVTWLNEQWLYDLIHPYVHEANFKAGWNWQWDFSESFQFTVYDPSGFYSWHKDGGSDRPSAYKRYIYGVHPELPKEDGKLPQGWVTTSQMVGKVRKISLTLNLNAPGDYDGGNLKFDFGRHVERDQFYECEEIRPQGSIVVFPSFLDHCVTPVTRGTRYSLVLWSLGQPFV
jgi:PKHD-type hydroxylase